MVRELRELVLEAITKIQPHELARPVAREAFTVWVDDWKERAEAALRPAPTFRPDDPDSDHVRSPHFATARPRVIVDPHVVNDGDDAGGCDPCEAGANYTRHAHPRPAPSVPALPDVYDSPDDAA